MISNLRAGRRVAYVVAAALVAIAGLAPLLHPGSVMADQMANRSITMSDSGPSGTSITTGVGSGTDVTYEVSFKTSLESGGNAESMVIDFCSEDPIINDTCTAPTGMDASSATVSASAASPSGTVSGWTITPSASQIKLASDGNPTNDAAPNTVQTFDLNGITNPSTTGSFYARMYTYTGTTFGDYASAASVGTYVDYGGVALSTAQVITITARVQETLSFCVSGADPSTWTTKNDCTDPQAATAPALTLGHGTPTKILDNTAIDTGIVYSQLSTNATSGAVIDMRDSNTSCGGLSADGGTDCNIPAIGTVSGTPGVATAMAAGTAAFGMTVTSSADGVNGTGTIVAAAPYNGTSGDYGMDTTADTGVTGEFGSLVASASAPCYRVNNSYTFAATASLTTPAGIYTANMDMIATGKF